MEIAVKIVEPGRMVYIDVEKKRRYFLQRPGDFWCLNTGNIFAEVLASWDGNMPMYEAIGKSIEFIFNPETGQ